MNRVEQFLLLREEEQKIRQQQGDPRKSCIVCGSRLYTGTRRCSHTKRFDTDLRCIDCLDLKQIRFQGMLIDIEEIEKAYLIKHALHDPPAPEPTPPVVETKPEPPPAEPVAPPAPKEEVMPETIEVRFCAKNCGRKLRSNNKNDCCTYCLRPWQEKRAAPIKDKPLGAKMANLPIKKAKKKAKSKAQPAQLSVDGLRFGLGTALKALFAGDIGKAEEWRKFITLAYPKQDVETAITAFIPAEG